jgi:1-phosphofructokinase
MIYTLTLNPSLDYMVEVNQLFVGRLNRTIQETLLPGGKGINVSQVLQRFHIKNTALGFTGGFTGEHIKHFLLEQGIDTDFVNILGDTRINVKIKSDEETEINAMGPMVSKADFSLLKHKIGQLTHNDMLILSGSIPSSMSTRTYEELVKICCLHGTRFVVDAEGDSLVNVIPFKPFLIKPNHHELGGIFHKDIHSVEDVISHGVQLLNNGAQHVLVSCADKGAILITEEAVWIGTAPSGHVVSSVGAGDSMVAGFITAFEKTKQLEDAFRFCIAAGSATAFSKGLCTKEMVERLLPEVKITKKEI